MTRDRGVRFLDRTTPPHIATLILLAGLGALSMNVFLPSLPGMAVYFDADYRVVQLSVTVYLAMNAVLQLFIGPISDRYGRRPVILAGIAIFMLATLGCIFAPTIEVFLAFRMIEAAIITSLVLSRAIIRDMVPQNEAASMIGYVTMGMAVVPMIGPVFGGVLDELFGWQANFWLLFLAGGAIAWLTWTDLGETAPLEATSFREQFADYPEVFGSRRFWGYCAASGCASGAFFAYLGGAPYVGTEVYGMSPATLGLFFGAPAMGYMVGNGISGRFSVRYGINRMIIWGVVISAIALSILLALDLIGFSGPFLFFGFAIFIGLGNGLVIPNSMAGMLSVRPHLAGSASGLGGAITIGSGAALSALAGSVLTLGGGALPLIALMLTTTLLSVVAAFYTNAVARQVGASG
ncbi:multidrug effflux MFS transporter [Ovoidimarina sediminis]|uniref:multidrug effflux MFS transporter n=1 Tax=Ovoidimarina sediminis TaxID=3079856 RepID=UPI002913AFF5|nr:multidrug effflux MFS transporter [Rhodophyticola sp. MJ-SS7]MDU8943054.1 multidrug effflux MFS transporter [Rhodophyticola sp. MJ-SS7]